MREIIRKFTIGHPKRMWRPTLWLFVESLSMAFPAVAVYFAINFIVLAFTAPADIGGLWVVAAVLGGLFVVQFLLSTGTFLNTFLPATVNIADSKREYVQKLRTLPLGYFLKKESGELINTFDGDFLNVEQSMVGMFTGIWAVVFSCLFTGAVLFLFNPTMALALYVCIPVAALIIALSMRLLMCNNRTNRKKPVKSRVCRVSPFFITH